MAMSPDRIEAMKKARVAAAKKRAAGGGSSKRAVATKRKVILFKAPADMRRRIYDVKFITGKDGLISRSQVVAHKSKPGSDRDVKLDMARYDAPTASALISRVGHVTFGTSMERRLPPHALIQVRLAVGARNADGAILARVRQMGIALIEDGQPGKTKLITRDNYPVAFRMLRKLNKVAAGAFAKCREFPDAPTLKAMLKADEEKAAGGSVKRISKKDEE